MYPFRWQPGGELRHATLVTEERRHGVVFTALCGQAVEADNSAIAWFWRTCFDCNARAHELAGVPMIDPT